MFLCWTYSKKKISLFLVYVGADKLEIITLMKQMLFFFLVNIWKSVLNFAV